jgi:hypothetical protein
MNEKQQKYSESFITVAIEKHLEDRDKDWQEMFKIHKLWLWTMFIVALASIFLCVWGIRFFVSEGNQWNEQGRMWNEYMREQSILSRNRELREIAKSRQDSIADVRDDSLAKAYIKEMSRYEKMPYYK